MLRTLSGTSYVLVVALLYLRLVILCRSCSYVQIVLIYIRLGHEHMFLMLLLLHHCPQVSNKCVIWIVVDGGSPNYR
jgi:hypothetical protein